MKEIFVKKYWVENDVTFYLHFQNGKAVAQVEISPTSKAYLSIETPVEGNSMLYDQKLEDLELDENNYISKADFITVWNNKK